MTFFLKYLKKMALFTGAQNGNIIMPAGLLIVISESTIEAKP
jgi:hypothetical protein